MGGAYGEQIAIHGWALGTAAVVSAACALVGTLLVVRRVSLLGDAIGHAVLPGIAIAVLAGGRPGGPLVFVGAVAAALATVWLSRTLHEALAVDEDAASGVVFTALFAAGVVIVSTAGSRIDIDPSCVLYGILELVPLDTVTVAGAAVPRAFLGAAIVFVGLVAAAALTWKLIVFTAFDPAAARALGMPVRAVATGTLAATALATVAGFEAVGAVLVVAMLVVPAAAAELLVRRLHHVAMLAVLFAVAGACAGYVAAWHWNTNAAGMIAVVLGIEYVAAAVLAPEEGIVSQAASRLRLAWRVACEDRLAAVWRAEEAAPVARAVAAPRAGMLDVLAAWWLWRDGSIEHGAGGERLTGRGRRAAEMVVRSHRLWEAWLGRHVDLPLDHLHPPAEWIEHHLGAEVRGRIEAELGRRESDPHGRDIPPEA
jgi:manganese/zinc/iron transport system permease protein